MIWLHVTLNTDAEYFFHYIQLIHNTITYIILRRLHKCTQYQELYHYFKIKND